jgi:hypothetical protein
VGDVLAAGEEAEEGASLFGHVIADGALERGMLGLQCVQNGAEGDRAAHFDCDVPIGELGEIPQVGPLARLSCERLYLDG